MDCSESRDPTFEQSFFIGKNFFKIILSDTCVPFALFVNTKI